MPGCFSGEAYDGISGERMLPRSNTSRIPVGSSILVSSFEISPDFEPNDGEFGYAEVGGVDASCAGSPREATGRSIGNLVRPRTAAGGFVLFAW